MSGTDAADAATELLPCPFCGGHPRLWRYQAPGVDSHWACYCNSKICQVSVNAVSNLREKAIAAWNRRAPQAARAAGVSPHPEWGDK